MVFAQQPNSQKSKIDTLKDIIQSATNDTVIINAWIEWDNLIYLNDPALDLVLNQKIDSLCSENLNKQLDESLIIFYKKSKSFALNNIGLFYYDTGDYLESIKYHLESLAIDKALKNLKGLANSYMNIGNNYYIQGDFSKAIEYYNKSLLMQEKMDDKKGMANSYMNIGNIYQLQKDYIKTIEYYNKSLEINHQIDDKVGLAGSLNNIGGAFKDQGDYQKAKEFYEQCLVLRIEMGDKHGTATVLSNLGSVYKSLDNFPKAMEFFSKSLAIKEEINDKLGTASTLKSIAGYYYKKGNYSKAIENAEKALKIALDLGVALEIRDASHTLFKSYKSTGDFKTALEMHELFLATRDSLDSEANQKAVIHQEYRYQYEKQAAADSVKAAEAAKVKDAQLATQKAEAEKNQLEADKQKQQKKYMYAGIGLLLIFGFFMWDRFRKSQKQNRIIEKQKTLAEIQKKEVENAHELLAEHHKEISDSIIYAKRIQDAIMPSIEDMNNALHQNFVLYLPKDVVAGDFFWMEQIEEVVYFAAADCTGHGVPGAMVSVICSNALNKSLLEDGIRDTGEILNRTREIVIERLARSGEDVKDGMDISLCALNTKTNHLQWSGANNSLWILRNNTDTIEEIKADKQPIGKYENQKPYSAHDFELNKGDLIYVYTDGYQDQFGGESNKKFKAQQLKSLIITNKNLSMEIQKEVLKTSFFDWKGLHEQIDDVCVIGVRI